MSILDIGGTRIDLSTDKMRPSSVGMGVIDRLLGDTGDEYNPFSLDEIYVLLTMEMVNKAQTLDELVARTGIDRQKLDNALVRLMMSSCLDTRSLFLIRRKEIIDAMGKTLDADMPDDQTPLEPA